MAKGAYLASDCIHCRLWNSPKNIEKFSWRNTATRVMNIVHYGIILRALLLSQFR